MTKVKICGITDIEDALFSVECGADLLGFNFYRQSPRYIAPQKAAAIIAQLPPSVETVGVFVNESMKDVLDVVEQTNVDVVQFHGDEQPSHIRGFKKLSEAKLIKALRVGPAFKPESVDDFDVDCILLDAFVPAAYGGTGETLNWSIASELAKTKSNIYLAGGLGPENVADAIKIVRPCAVDVASGIESSPGVKDLTKLKAFILNAKSV